MSSSTIERTSELVDSTEARATPEPGRVGSPRPTQPRVRPARSRRGPSGRADRSRGPRLRPELFARFSTGGRARSSVSRPQGCAVSTPSQWRLTDRGIAVVLVAGLMVVVAAVTVVAATAIHVTGDSYAPNIASQAASR